MKKSQDLMVAEKTEPADYELEFNEQDLASISGAIDKFNKNPYNLDKETFAALEKDNKTVALSARQAFQIFAPAYYIDKDHFPALEENTDVILGKMLFFKIAGCTIDDQEDLTAKFHERMSRVLTAAYSAKQPVCFGLIGRKEGISIVIGFNPAEEDASKVDKVAAGIMQSQFQGLDLALATRVQPIRPSFWGTIEAVPKVLVGDQTQKVDYAGLSRLLYGSEFNLLTIARPISESVTTDCYHRLLQVQTNCSKALKHTFSLMDTKGLAVGRNEQRTHTETHSHGFNQGLNLTPFGIGPTAGAHEDSSTSDSTSVGNQVNFNIGESMTRGCEVANRMAKELSDLVERAIERFRVGSVIGHWDCVTTFSTITKQTFDLIHRSLRAELVRADKDMLPLAVQTYSADELKKASASRGDVPCEFVMPRGMLKYGAGAFASDLRIPMNTDELASIITLPESTVPGFSFVPGRFYGVSDPSSGEGDAVGCICEGSRALPGSSFSFSKEDLNKHTFVCGITGCGKTTTVKRILESVRDIPYLVIECAKKEYRNLEEVEGGNVYTLGHPEINSLRFNPFYVQKGVSLHTHIDFLKDLFNASFSFYGPMTYILETCLHRIYEKKGWDITTGDHPNLVNEGSDIDRYDSEEINKRYSVDEHRMVFPSMTDLLNEVKLYIENELNYDGEVAGNIKSAMLARLESLCNGAKGYMFDTTAAPDVQKLLSKKSVIELEGLADDSDKAFAVGLLIILINEFRMVDPADRAGLRHLMVIEEAHRLLKNVSTERQSESLGNPKGKAVEHFTNILAEMRSYGQGVIIAEQIPSKIAVDVIKNSSNKIVHRLVSADDQQLMANTIGVAPEDAIYFGNQRPGIALCHKEGMATPLSIKFTPVEGSRKDDLCIRNACGKTTGREMAIWSYKIWRNLPKDTENQMFRLFCDLMRLEAEVRNARKDRERTAHALAKDGEKYVSEFFDKVVDRVRMRVPCRIEMLRAGLAAVLSEMGVAFICSGAFSNARLPEGMLALLKDTFLQPISRNGRSGVSNVETLIAKNWGLQSIDKAGNLVYQVVAESAIKCYFESRRRKVHLNREKLVRSFFLHPSDDCVNKICARISEKAKRWEVHHD